LQKITPPPRTIGIGKTNKKSFGAHIMKINTVSIGGNARREARAVQPSATHPSPASPSTSSRLCPGLNPAARNFPLPEASKKVSISTSAAKNSAQKPASAAKSSAPEPTF
jgi:hypothetical protein